MARAAVTRVPSGLEGSNPSLPILAEEHVELEAPNVGGMLFCYFRSMV